MDIDILVIEIERHIEDAIYLAETHLKYDGNPCGDSPRMAILTRLLDVKAETGHLRSEDIL
jgi:hypothetical protein